MSAKKTSKKPTASSATAKSSVRKSAGKEAAGKKSGAKKTGAKKSSATGAQLKKTAVKVLAGAAAGAVRAIIPPLEEVAGTSEEVAGTKAGGGKKPATASKKTDK
jgi:hypothetical protein